AGAHRLRRSVRRGGRRAGRTRLGCARGRSAAHRGRSGHRLRQARAAQPRADSPRRRARARDGQAGHDRRLAQIISGRAQRHRRSQAAIASERDGRGGGGAGGRSLSACPRRRRHAAGPVRGGGDGMSHLRWKDIAAMVVDVAIVYYVTYRVLLLVKGTRAVQILVGLILFGGGFFLAKQLPLATVAWLLDNLASSATQ